MQITSRSTVAVHILTCIEIFGGEMRVTSDFLSGSTGVNAVIVRNVLGQLREAGIIMPILNMKKLNPAEMK